MDLRRIVGYETLSFPVIVDCSLLTAVATCNNGNSQYARESLVGGTLQLCVVEVEIAEPPKKGRLILPCGEGGCTAYKSQRFSIPQREKRILSDLVKDHLTPHLQENHCQRDV
jgi:hypothetical protein